MHMNEIWSIDKKQVIQCPDNLPKDMEARIRKYGNSWSEAVENYFHEKNWVCFNKTPFKKEQRQLFDRGYYKYNKTPCGQCEICRIEKSRQWAVKAAAERKVWKNACFLTLTYRPNDPIFVATKGTINKSTMQAFWKKLRYHLYKETKNAKEIDLKPELETMQEIPKEIEYKYMISKRKPNKKPIRYIQANEYGEKKGRCHHHAIVFNFNPTDLKRYSKDRRGYWIYTSDKINKIWGHGHVIIGKATTNAAAYVGRYCTKKHSKTSKYIQAKIIEAKINNDEEELKIWKAKKESISASSLGYIGSYYWETNKEEVKRNNGIIVAWNKGVRLEKIPKPMEKQWEIEDPETYEWYDYWKEKTGKEQWEKILSKTDLSEEEYIKTTYEQRTKKIEKLLREYDEKPLYS